MTDYTPEAGDLVWLEFDPQASLEQKGRRPGLVISPASYNQKVGLMLCCPIISKAKGYPFEVEVAAKEVSGVVLADQIKSLDWRARNAAPAGKAASEVLGRVRDMLRLLTEIS